MESKEPEDSSTRMLLGYGRPDANRPMDVMAMVCAGLLSLLFAWIYYFDWYRPLEALAGLSLGVMGMIGIKRAYEAGDRNVTFANVSYSLSLFVGLNTLIMMLRRFLH